MSDPLLDDLARTLARPMPRRRAVRVMAAGFLAASFPALRPGRAAGQGCGNCVTPQGNEVPCCEAFGSDAKCCNSGTDAVTCCPPDGVCCPPAAGQGSCCPAGTQCEARPGGGPLCIEPCPDGRSRCNDECCKDDEECVEGKCLVKCPPKRTRCRDQCCPKGKRCVRGKCRECPEDRKACGKKCCDRGEECYWVDDDPDRKICCDCGKRGKRDCCPVGPPEESTATCCPQGDRCAKQINQGEGGITADSPTVCCPKKRQVPLPGADVCCPPGYRSMGGKLVVTPCTGDQTSDLCCREDLVCGSGNDITCCATPGFDPACTQKCCNGVCRSIKVDRNNCGSCGNVCPTGQRCENGSCVPA